MPSSHVEKIKERLLITDVVGAYLKLEKSGAQMKARCPFHNEKTASFYVSPARNTYYCFGCGAKGDIFEFVQQFEGLDFRGALKVLADRAGVPLTFESQKDTSKEEILFRIHEDAARFFQSELGKNKEALLYLKKRGLAIEMVRDWRIGFAPDGWRNTYTFLQGRGYSDEMLELSGLVKRADNEYKGARVYDRFRNRIMFPIFDSSARVVAFSGRILKDEPNAPKYLNSPETPIWNKSSMLYGLHKAKHEIRTKGFAILVEGQMDLLMSHQAGFGNTVATSGTALAESLVKADGAPTQLGLLKRLAPAIFLAFDADSAGMKASERAIGIALAAGIEVKVIRIEGGKDPADLIRDNPKNWEEAVAGSKHVIEYLLESVLMLAPDARAQGPLIREKVLPRIADLVGNMEQAHFVKMIAKRAGVPEEAVWADLKEVVRTRKPTAVVSAPPPQKTQNPFQERMWGVLFWLEISPQRKKEYDEIETEMKRILGAEHFQKELSKRTETKGELATQAEILYDGTNSAPLQKELLHRFESEILRERQTALLALMHNAEAKKDKEKITTLIKQSALLASRIKQLESTLDHPHEKK